MRTLVRWIVAAVLVIGFSVAGSHDSDAIGAPRDGLPTFAPPCIHEDGSGQRTCVWVASIMGNGEGRSFVMVQMDALPRTYTYVKNRRAKRMLNRWKARYCGPMTSANPDDRVCTHWQFTRH